MLLSSIHLLGLWLLMLAVEGNYSLNLDANPTNHEPFSRSKRLLMKTKYLWPKGIIPYTFEDSVLYLKDEIERVIVFIEDKSCLRFLPAKTYNRQLYALGHNANISFFKGDGCFSAVGFGGGSIRTSCCTGEACLHEIGHALGFDHEQENPKRVGWIDVNMDFIPESNKGWYMQTSSDMYNYSRPYDISTMMHYFPVEFTKGKPAYSKDFPELSIAQQYFYFFKEMAEGYKCTEYPQCQGHNTHCDHDGYSTVVHGVCRCECPTGLDPDQKCSVPLKKVVSASWPRGRYSLPNTNSGCPQDGQFVDGQVALNGIDGNTASNPFHLMGTFAGRESSLHFCTRNDQEDLDSKFNWPLGNYCIFMKGNTCPIGFDVRSIQYHADSFATTGQTPEMTSRHIRLCCQFRGFPKEPASFPTDKPFALIKYAQKCQKVTGMLATNESFTIKSSERFIVDSHLSKWVRDHGKSLTVPICYYTSVDMDCGDVRTLSKVSPETTIDMSGVGRVNAECTWVVKGDTDKGTFVIDFQEFNMRKHKGACVDKVEVRHAMIGQHGQEYCGQVGHSIRSIKDKIMLRFLTVGNSDSYFKAKIRWIPFDDMCYNVNLRGVEYDGGVDYTRRFQPCVPWAEVTECPHNPYLMQRSEHIDRLDGSSCRNPDNSFRPWCYTDKSSCARNYCDVCGLEKPYDLLDNCKALKADGFCTHDVAKATQYCSATCYDQFANKPLTRKYTDVSCGRPTAPTDGSLIGSIKSSYKLGETVDYRCNSGGSVVTSRCMTSGQWSKVASACRACPRGYTIIHDGCFGVPKGAKSVTYAEASRICKREGGTVAAPRSEEQAHIISKIAKSHYTWIGMTDTVTEGQWLYEDGTPVVWTNWDKSEPNNINNEDYVVMKTSTKWMDVPGTYAYAFVCVIPKWETPGCADVLPDQCPNLLAGSSTMCQDQPDFAIAYCAKTCAVCAGEQVHCPVQNNAAFVKQQRPATSITAGQFMGYTCTGGTRAVEGNEVRACLLNGKLAGKPLRCGDCPNGFRLVGNSCYGLSLGGKLAFAEARARCQKLGGFVAMAKSFAENAAISSLSGEGYTWIGATSKTGAGIHSFVWEDGTKVKWGNWAPGQPKSLNGGTECVVMNENKQWMTIECENPTYNTVCTTLLPEMDCDTNGRGGVCYTFMDRSLTYQAGVAECAKFGGTVATPKNLEENQFINRISKNKYTWLGISDRKIEGKWMYDTPNGSPIHWTRWHTSEPNNAGGNEDCAIMMSDGQWEDVPCLYGYPLVCGIPKAESQVKCGSPTPPSDGKAVGLVKAEYNAGDTMEWRCVRSDWSVFSRCMANGEWSQSGYACLECPGVVLNNKCYTVVDKELNYDKAVAYCQGFGGTVAAPRNQKEADLVIKLMKQQMTWVGATDQITEGEWKYKDGTDLSWTNWNKAEPNNLGPQGEDCIVMEFDTKWIDVPCNYAYRSVCEKVLPTLGVSR